MVHQAVDTVPLLQGLREHNVEASVYLGTLGPHPDSRRRVINTWLRRGPLNEQILGQEVNEGFPDPWRHLVGGGSAEVDIEDTCNMRNIG